MRLNYTIVEVKSPIFYDMLLNEQEQNLLRASNYSFLPIEEEHAALFDAEYARHALNNQGDRWLICWDSRIVYLKASWVLTEEQLAIIADTLKP